MALSITKNEFVKILQEQKILSKPSIKYLQEKEKYQIVISEVWKAKFQFKPNWFDPSPETIREKETLKRAYR